MEFSSNTMEVLDLLFEKFGIVVDWANKNIVPYMQDLACRIVRYEIIGSIAGIILSLATTFILLWAVKYSYKKGQRDEFFEGLHVLFSILFGVSCIVSAVVVYTQVYDIITCLTLPEKVILDMVSGMTK